jgi:hypothetical protein
MYRWTNLRLESLTRHITINVMWRFLNIPPVEQGGPIDDEHIDGIQSDIVNSDAIEKLRGWLGDWDFSVLGDLMRSRAAITWVIDGAWVQEPAQRPLDVHPSYCHIEVKMTIREIGGTGLHDEYDVEVVDDQVEDEPSDEMWEADDYFEAGGDLPG